MLSFEASSEHFLVDRNDRARGCRSGGGGARLSGLGGPTVRKKTFIRHTITRIRSILHGQLATNAIKSRRQIISSCWTSFHADIPGRMDLASLAQFHRLFWSLLTT